MSWGTSLQRSDGGCLYNSDFSGWASASGGGSSYARDLNFDASKSNPSYQERAEVKTKNFTYKIWNRKF